MRCVDIVPIKIENPNAQIIELSSFRSADECRTCFPDIMIVKGRSATFVEVKTGKASWTGSQSAVYPEINQGTAVLTNEQVKRLQLPPGKHTVKDVFPDGHDVKTVYGPGYLD